MIARLKGEIVSVEEDKVVVDVNGVGYGVYMTQSSLSQCAALGKEIVLYTYLSVREDAMQLFGFISEDDLHVFKLIIAVSGIGPKGGLNILSTLSPDELRFAVVSGDSKTISKAPGIGKKMAEKLIIELKDKLKLEDVLEHDAENENINISLNHEIQSQVVEALTALGYSASDALRAVKQVNYSEFDTVETVLKQALKFMF